MTTIIFKTPAFLMKAGGYDKIEKYISDFLSLLPEGISFDAENLSEMLSVRFILNEICSSLSGEGSRAKGFLATLLAAILLSYIAVAFDKASPFAALEKNLSCTASSAIALVALFPAVREIFSLAETVGDSLSQIVEFFASLIPLLTSLAVSGGGAEGAAVTALQMSALASVIELLCAEILVPLLYAAISLGAISALGGVATERLLMMIRNALTKGLGLISLLVSALFTMQSLIASAKDTMSLRLARFTAQSMAPSVGAIISASMSTLASGISYARGVVGVGAVFAIISMVVSPALPLVIYRFFSDICQGLAVLFGVKTVERALGAMKYALDGLLSVYFVSAALLVLQLILFLVVGVRAL